MGEKKIKFITLIVPWEVFLKIANVYLNTLVFIIPMLFLFMYILESLLFSFQIQQYLDAKATKKVVYFLHAEI